MNKSRILVVDDETDLERLIKQRFRKKIQNQELEFIFASNGQKAIEKLQIDSLIDLVLTDLNMPVMDGFTLLNKIQEIDQTIKAIVISAYGDLKNIRTAMNRGAFDFLLKPIDFQDLEITLQKTIEFVHQVREKQQQLQTALEKLSYLAFYDELTNLANRSLLLNSITKAIDRNSQVPNSLFAVLFLELDRYQTIKYSLGHTLADQLLIEVAERFKNCIQPPNLVARVGTKEFAILVDEVSSPEAVQDLANQLHQVLQSPFNLERATCECATSIGIAFSALNFENPEDYLRAADTAAQYHKQTGVSSTTFFNRSMQVDALDCLQLEADLKEAIQNQQLSLVYQPIICLATNRMIGLEALVRWEHFEKGMIPPSRFIPIAEKTGLILPLGEFILNRACQELNQWQAHFSQQLPLSIGVNLSSIQITNSDLISQVDHLLKEFSLSGKSLKLEITESVLMENSTLVTHLLEQLKLRDIELLIDDFGTGYSSLSYLQCLPIDILKIDRSFIQELEQNEKNLEIVKTIVNLAKSLDLKVIAEGVENVEQLKIIQDLKCHYGQGYLFSTPLKSVQVQNIISSQFNDFQFRSN